MTTRRSLDDLHANAERFWPESVSSVAAELSVVPRLIETQEKFIGVLYVADSGPTAWKIVLDQSKGLPGNLFLKHLMVLGDFGGEPLKRLKPDLRSIFSEGPMEYVWNGKSFRHEFQSLARGNWSNKELHVDGARLLQATDLSPAMLDVAMLILFGAAAVTPGLPELVSEKCSIGAMIGRKGARSIRPPALHLGK